MTAAFGVMKTVLTKHVLLRYEHRHAEVPVNEDMMNHLIEDKLTIKFYEISIISGVVVAVPGRVAALRL